MSYKGITPQITNLPLLQMKKSLNSVTKKISFYSKAKGRILL